METHEEPSWIANKEKLLCLIVLDDGIVQKMMPGAPPAFCRAFIVQNRDTGLIYCKYRFKHADGRNWYRIVPEEQNADTVEVLRRGFEITFKTATAMAGGDYENAFQCFYPPDDKGDPGKTIIWLEQKDLIEISVESPRRQA